MINLNEAEIRLISIIKDFKGGGQAIDVNRVLGLNTSNEQNETTRKALRKLSDRGCLHCWSKGDENEFYEYKM